MDPMTVNVVTSSGLVQVITDRSFAKRIPCLYQMIDALFDYRPHYGTNFTDHLAMDGPVDIIFQPLARNFNSSFPNVSISVPFGSTSCFIAHTIPNIVQFLDVFQSISFISKEVTISSLIATLFGCWILFPKNFVQTIWISIQLLVNQVDDYTQTTARTKKNGSIILLMLIVSITLIKFYFGVHFSTQLTVAQTFPTLDSIQQMTSWNITKCAQIYTICPSLLTGTPAWDIYNSKLDISGNAFHQMGNAAPGKVISLLAFDEISTLKNKMCFFHPDKRLHVSPPFAQTTISFPIYSFMSPKKEKFITNYLRTIMEMGLDKIRSRCDIQGNHFIGDWNCANQVDGILHEAHPIPILFFIRYFNLLLIIYLVLCTIQLFLVIHKFKSFIK